LFCNHALTVALALAPALATAAPLPVAPKPKPAAATKPTTRQSIEQLLRASERPPGPAELAAVGTGAEDALVAIAADAGAEATLRGRATGALAHAASPRARTFLMDVVTRGAAEDPAAATPADRVVLRRAAVALGWQAGPGAPPALGALLAHADPEVRTDAAVGLGLTRLAPAASLLRNHLAIEKDPKVRSHVARQLSAIESSLGLADARHPPAPSDPEAAPPAAEAPTDLPRSGTKRRTPAPPPPTRMQPNRSRF
jgi:HEAT repeats